MAFDGSQFLKQFQGIERDPDLAQLRLSGVGEHFGTQEPLVRCLGWIVALTYLRSLPVFLQFERRLEEVHEQVRHSIKAPYRLGCSDALKPAITEEFADMVPFFCSIHAWSFFR
jgi:hypothetical protein